MSSNQTWKLNSPKSHRRRRYLGFSPPPPNSCRLLKYNSGKLKQRWSKYVPFSPPLPTLASFDLPLLIPPPLLLLLSSFSSPPLLHYFPSYFHLCFLVPRSQAASRSQRNSMSCSCSTRGLLLFSPSRRHHQHACRQTTRRAS